MDLGMKFLTKLTCCILIALVKVMANPCLPVGPQNGPPLAGRAVSVHHAVRPERVASLAPIRPKVLGGQGSIGIDCESLETEGAE